MSTRTYHYYLCKSLLRGFSILRNVLSRRAEEGYNMRISFLGKLQIQSQSSQISHLPFVSGGAKEGQNIRISSPGKLQIQGQEGPEAKKKKYGPDMQKQWFCLRRPSTFIRKTVKIVGFT